MALAVVLPLLRGALVAIVVVARLARIVHLTRQVVAYQLTDLASLTANDLNAVAFEHAFSTCTHIACQHNSHTLSLQDRSNVRLATATFGRREGR